jgi:adenylate kinase
MQIIMLGAPGAGKGTISKMIVEKEGSVQISTGDILRHAVKEQTPVGKKAQEYMTRGDLVPDSVILDIMKERLLEKDCDKGYILDGFPRTIPQAEALDVMLDNLGKKLSAAVNLVVPEEKIVARLSSRRTCSNPDCQAIYNVLSSPSKDGAHCDKCGSPIVQRDDETEAAIAQRLKTYNDKTSPLIEYYRKKGLLISVNGDQMPEKVFDEVMGAVKK